MFRLSTAALAASLLMSGALPQAWSQTAINGADGAKTRAQVVTERDEWLRTHRWDPGLDDWVVKDECKTPAMMCTQDESRGETRQQVREARDDWLRTHRWDPGADEWMLLEAQPRDPGGLTRDQVHRETLEFLRNHEWDDPSSSWKLKPSLR